MASITLSGTLLDPVGFFAIGDKIRFTHETNTGKVVKSSITEITIPTSGSYLIELQYGMVRVDYQDIKSSTYTRIGSVTVNQDSTATTIPELLLSTVPPTDEQLLEFQELLQDCKDQVDLSEGFAEDSEQSAINAANSANDAAQAIAAIRYSELDNPIVHLFKKNNLVSTLSGNLTWSRASAASYIDRQGVLRYAAIDEPRQDRAGWLVEGSSTNFTLNSNDVTLWLNNTDVTVTKDYGISPDGNINSNRIVANVSSSNTKAGNLTAGVVSIGDVVTQSVWIKASILNGSVKLGGNLKDVTSELVMGEWVRVYATLNSFDVNTRCYIYLDTDGDDIEIYNGQVEPLPFATSTIQTTDSTVTRASDFVWCDGVGNYSDPNKGLSWFQKVDVIGYYNPFAESGIVEYPSGGGNFLVNNNSLTTQYTSCAKVSGAFDFRTFGAYTQGASSFASILDGTSAAAYKNNTLTDNNDDGVRWKNEEPSKIRFYDNGNNFYGYFSDFRMYDFALNAAEVEFLTGG